MVLICVSMCIQFEEMCSYHSILSALDSLVDNLPTRTLESSEEISIMRPLADDLL